jgi:hypothetical protein
MFLLLRVFYTIINNKIFYRNSYYSFCLVTRISVIKNRLLSFDIIAQLNIKNFNHFKYEIIEYFYSKKKEWITKPNNKHKKKEEKTICFHFHRLISFDNQQKKKSLYCKSVHKKKKKRKELGYAYLDISV